MWRRDSCCDLKLKNTLVCHVHLTNLLIYVGLFGFYRFLISYHFGYTRGMRKRHCDWSIRLQVVTGALSLVGSKHCGSKTGSCLSRGSSSKLAAVKLWVLFDIILYILGFLNIFIELLLSDWFDLWSRLLMCNTTKRIVRKYFTQVCWMWSDWVTLITKSDRIGVNRTKSEIPIIKISTIQTEDRVRKISYVRIWFQLVLSLSIPLWEGDRWINKTIVNNF